MKLDGGCYLLQSSFFQRDTFNEGIVASVNNTGSANRASFRFNPTFRQNFKFDAGPTGFDAGTYDFALVTTATPPGQWPFSLIAAMNTGPLGGPIGASYVATAGTVTINQLTTPPSSETRGRFDGVVLREFSSLSTILDGGRCAVLADTTFHTLVPTGIPCSFATDCGDSFAKSCQPATQTCQPRGCDGSTYQVGNQVCLPQSGGAYALYPDCSNDGGCKTTESCVPLTGTGVSVCLAYGTTPEDQPCAAQTTDLNTGCVAGLNCGYPPGSITRVCIRPCDRFAAMPGCRTNQRCFSSICTTPNAAFTDPAAVGQSCAVNQIAKACGDDGLAYRGVCAFEAPDGGPAMPPPGPVPRKCHKSCVTQAQCATGQQCLEQSCW